MADRVYFNLFKLELKTHAGLLKYNIFYTPIDHYRVPKRTFVLLILSNHLRLDPEFCLCFLVRNIMYCYIE